MNVVPSVDEVTAKRLRALKLAYADLKRRPENRGLEGAFMTLLRDAAEAIVGLYGELFAHQTSHLLDRQKILLRLAMMGLTDDLATAVYAAIVERMVRDGFRINSGVA